MEGDCVLKARRTVRDLHKFILLRNITVCTCGKILKMSVKPRFLLCVRSISQSKRSEANCRVCG